MGEAQNHSMKNMNKNKIGGVKAGKIRDSEQKIIFFGKAQKVQRVWAPFG